MKKEFIPYQPSLDMKGLGFDEPCFAYYDNALQIRLCSFEKMSNKGFVSAPTFSQSFRFFREKYGLEGVIQQAEDFTWYKWKISQYNEDGKKYVADWYEYKAYEEAELACLIKLIEIANEK
jgi:hypothetical protein